MVNVMANNWEGWQEVRLFLSHTGDSLAQGWSEVKRDVVIAFEIWDIVP